MSEEKNYKKMYEDLMTNFVCVSQLASEFVRDDRKKDFENEIKEKYKAMNEVDNIVLHMYMEDLLRDYCDFTRKVIAVERKELSVSAYLSLRDSALFEMATILKTGNISDYMVRTVCPQKKELEKTMPVDFAKEWEEGLKDEFADFDKEVI